MLTNSFRLRLALLSALVSGGLLIAGGVLVWGVVYRIELARVDRELRNLGTPHLERVLGGDHWVRVESALGFVAGSAATPAFILRVKNEDRLVHQSPGWPADLDPATLPVLAEFTSAPGESLPPPPRRGEEISKRNPALPRKTPEFVTREAGGRRWRIGVMGNPYVSLVLAADLAELDAGMSDLRRVCLLGVPVALVLVGLGAWLLASRALRPVRVLTAAAERVTARGLDQRIPATAHDREFNRLVTVFNEMLDRLEASFHQATRFSADAAHELKTPLTILQGELEHALQSATVGSEAQREYGRLLEEIGRLRAITEKLLLLAQADAGRLTLQREPVALSAAVAEAVEDLQVLAPELRIEARIAPGVKVAGDQHLLPQLVQNLTTNAVKYNQPGGRIIVELSREGASIVLRVGNTGPGIPVEARGKVFDRFFRADGARARESGGVGLGLSLAREIARAHGGELDLEPLESGPDTLTWFRLRLPSDAGSAASGS